MFLALHKTSEAGQLTQMVEHIRRIIKRLVRKQAELMVIVSIVEGVALVMSTTHTDRCRTLDQFRSQAERVVVRTTRPASLL